MTAAYTDRMVSWHLGGILDEHGITTYRLSQELGTKISRDALYKITKGQTKRVELETLDLLLDALKVLTGRDYEVGDLLKKVPSDVLPS